MIGSFLHASCGAKTEYQGRGEEEVIGSIPRSLTSPICLIW